MRRTLLLACTALLVAPTLNAQRTVKPVLHGRHWVAITGKPLGATAGAMTFQKGGNAVDAAVGRRADRCEGVEVGPEAIGVDAKHHGGDASSPGS